MFAVKKLARTCRESIGFGLLFAIVVPALFAGAALAQRRFEAPTLNDVSPAGIHAMLSNTTDPAKRAELESYLPDITPGLAEAARDFVKRTHQMGLESRSGRLPVIGSGPANVNANTDHSSDPVGDTQAEVAVACFGDTVVIGWNDSKGLVTPASFTVSRYSYSTDGGVTFTEGPNVPRSLASDQAFGDPGLDTDEKGNWYYVQLYTRTAGNPGPTAQQNVAVHHGRFNGSGVLVWDSPVQASIGTSSTGNLDKCLLACDRVTGNVYVGYVRFLGNGAIEIVRSTTLGATWGAPIILDNTNTPTASKSGTRVFCGPGGEVYVTWEKGANTIFCNDGAGNIPNTQGQMAFTRSLNNGVSYDPFTVIGTVDHGWTWSGPGDLRERGNEFPDIAVDRSGLSTNGNIYVTWHETAPWTVNNAGGVNVTETNGGATDAGNNNPGGATPFTVNTNNPTGTLTATTDIDYWSFTATQGENIFFELDPANANCSTGLPGTTVDGTRFYRFRIYASQSPFPCPTSFPDTLLAASSISGFIDRIVWTAPKTGTFIIRVSYGAGATGAYAMRVRDLAGGSFGGANPARDGRDVVIVRSVNQGLTWSSEQRINDSPAGLEERRPFIGVDSRGHVHVFWHDNRDAGLGANAALASIYGTTSRDGGVTWTPNYEVTDQLSFFSLNTIAVPNLGDYNQAACGVSGGVPVIHPAWSDQRQSGINGDVRQCPPATPTYTAGRGPEAYTARVIFKLAVTSDGDTKVTANNAVKRNFTITNTGTIQDSYTWTVTDDHGWLSGSTTGTTAVLQPGASANVSVVVTSPDCHASTDSLRIVATPVGDADDSQRAGELVTFSVDPTIPAVIAGVSTSTFICPTNTCVTLPVNITRCQTTKVLGFSVTIQLSPNLTLCNGKASITEGTFLSASGGTIFNVITNGGGSYTVDGAAITCGPTATAGNLFNVAVTSSDPGGSGTLTVTATKLRDCSNSPLPVNPGAPATVPIDNQAPSVTVISPNGGESWLIGTSQKISWTATDNTGVASVDLAYSTDGGSTYPNVIATGLANSGTFTWTVPNTPTTTARVRVTAHDAACATTASDASDANFTIRDPIIVATAGPGGSINPSGSVSVPYGGSQKFDITPADKCHAILDVKVDGSSVGPVASYTFSSVTTDHTIDATFKLLGPFTITATAGAGGTISPSGAVSVACGGSQTFSISPADKCHAIADVKVDGVSVGPVATYTFSDVQANHTIDASFSGFGPFTITASAGTGGQISPNGAVSVNCGASQAFSITPNACFHILDVKVDNVSVGPVASYTFTDVQANHTISATFAPNALSTTAVTDLAASQLRTGNDADGTTKIKITYSTPAGAASVEVWRKGFGSYPTYDDGGGSVPTSPGSYPPAGWTQATLVTASGQYDEPPTRDFWYYVAYAKDACGNAAPVSNMTGGNLDYHLGDVSDGFTPGQGDNQVSTADVSLLGSHYGISGVALAPYNYLDVGPTTDFSVNARPTTDGKTDFEDLVMYALNYFPAASLAESQHPVTPAASDAIWLVIPGRVSSGQVFDVQVRLAGAGDLQAVSAALKWNSAIATPIASSAGEMLSGRGVMFPPHLGQVDCALLGIGSQGMVGEGTLATVQFRAIGSGDPGLGIDHVIGRDASNRDASVQISAPVAVKAKVTVTSLGKAFPNPARASMSLSYSLAKGGPVQLGIYSVDGRRIKTLVTGVQESGAYQMTWDGTDDHGHAMRSGVFYIRLDAAGVRQTQMISMLR